MKRILQVCNTDFYLNRFLRPLVRSLVERGFSVECICFGDHVHPEFEALGVRVHSFDFPKRADPFSFARAIRRFTRFLQVHRYDCVNSHNRNASIIARVACWRAKVPVNLYTAHGFYFHDDQSRLSRLATEGIEGALSQITHHTLSQSDEDVQRMIRHRWIRPHAIQTIGNGIDTVKFSPSLSKADACKKLGLNNVFRVAAVGRMVRGKGFHDLIHAFARLRSEQPTELLFIGGNISNDINPALAESRQLIHSLGLDDRVQITGIVDNVEEHIAASDVFVLPSYREGMPRALLEAMCMGLPVIGTSIRGCREIISEGVDGFLYTPHSVDELTHHLNTVLTMGEERKRMGERAREKVVETYDERHYVERQVKAIARLLHPF